MTYDDWLNEPYDYLDEPEPVGRCAVTGKTVWRNDEYFEIDDDIVLADEIAAYCRRTFTYHDGGN